MKKTLFITVFVFVLVFCLAGCGSSSSGSSSVAPGSSSSAAESETSSKVTSEESADVQKDFDGSSFDDIGVGVMYLVTGGGTSENGNVPQVAGSGDPYNTMMTIELDYWDGDGSVCTVYVDGVENMKINAGDLQTTVGLTGDALVEGIHTVEVVKMDGDKPVVYKRAQYEMVY